MSIRRRAARAITWCVVLSLAGCASWPRRYGAHPCAIAGKPAVGRQPIGWHLFDVTILTPLKKPFHLVRAGRRMFGVPVRAMNLKDGELTASAFYVEPDVAQWSPEEVRWGPTAPGDRPQGPFVITKPKIEGKTPGFFVTDARGVRYLFKLDPVDAPELLSGAEVVTSKLLYALGYHVPSYEVADIRPEELQIKEGTMVRAQDGERRPFTDAELQPLLEGRLREGTLRVSASRILDGEILGPARFKQFRDCAEVRALKIAYAWLNNIDAKDHNSLLVWDGTGTSGYLIDFGTSLGADAGYAGPKDPCAGWLNSVDLQEASLKLVTLGLHQPVCDPQGQPVSPSIGLFSPNVNPDRWKPYAPNLAFDEMNAEDARWLARRMARLTRAHIEAAVSAGAYTNPADAEYLVEVLEERRAAIVQHYLGDVG